MIKLLCFPITKLALFLGSFFAAIYALRTSNLIFDRMIAFALDPDALIRRPLYEGVYYGRGMVFFGLLFCLFAGLLSLAVWKTKANPEKAAPLVLWRRFDFRCGILCCT